MASLKTHLQYSTAGSGVLATFFLGSNLLTPAQALMSWVLGIIGGLLPDIDADESQGGGTVFGILSVLSVALAVILANQKLPLLWVLLLGSCVFLAIRYGLPRLLQVFTQHRGVCHTLIAIVFFTLITAILSKILGASPTTSWFYAMFLGLGYLGHLVLDEVYVEDFTGKKKERRFGEALKLLDTKEIKHSLILTAVTLALFYFAPSYAEFSGILFSASTYGQILASML